MLINDRLSTFLTQYAGEMAFVQRSLNNLHTLQSVLYVWWYYITGQIDYCWGLLLLVTHNLSGLVAHDLSGFHTAPRREVYEVDRVAAGDPTDEI